MLKTYNEYKMDGQDYKRRTMVNYQTEADRNSDKKRKIELGSWVQIPPGAWIFVYCECRVLSGRGLCDELITRPEESYRLCCVVVCDLETSRMGAPYIYDISSLKVKEKIGYWKLKEKAMYRVLWRTRFGKRLWTCRKNTE